MKFRKWRKPTYFFVDLEVNRVRFSLRLVDITPEGARLFGNHEVVDGTAGVITVRDKKVPGTLRWVEGENIGFEFDTPLSPRFFATLADRKNEAQKGRFLVS
ncbi:MAG: PilZ domain-containing protein [Paracoccaceae bacterium]